MPPAKSSTLQPQTGWVVLLLIAATGLKVAWAFTSAGSADAHLFFLFGKVLQTFRLRDLYDHQPLFNHTPLVGFSVRCLYRFCDGDFQSFSTAWRSFGIVADIAVVLGLLHVRAVTGKPPFWALALFAISPVSLMVSGFHASPDPVLVMAFFFAAVAVLHERPVHCALFFALACNIKAMAVLLSPLFLILWFSRGRRDGIRFTTVSGLGLLAGSALPLWECPATYLRHVFGYGGYWGWWGIPYWLKQTGLAALQRPDFQNLSPAQNLTMTVLKLVIIAGIITLAWRRRHCAPREFFATLGAAWTLLFVFATGAGVHYMVWFGPFILLLAPGWWAALTAASTIFIFVFYQTGSEHHAFPWISSVTTFEQLPSVAPWSNLPWAVFITFFVLHGRSWFNPHPAAPKPFEIPGDWPASVMGEIDVSTEVGSQPAI